MKKLTKLKIVFDRIFNKFVKVDNIEKIEEGLNRQKEALKNLNNSYYNAQGALESYKNELKKNQENEKKLNKCFGICKTKNDKEGAKQIFEELNTTKQRIIVLKEQSQKQELIVQRFKEAKERYEKEIRNLQNNLETMKSKNRFSKAVKEYESQLINILSSGIFKVFDNASLQIRSILNPNHFIIDGKWIKSSHFYEFYTQNSLYFKVTDEIVNTLYLAAPWPIIMKKEEQPQKGAAIFAAYSFFGWDLRW